MCCCLLNRADCVVHPAVLQMGSIALVLPLMMFITYQVRGWHNCPIGRFTC